jgi:hypothetical protein
MSETARFRETLRKLTGRSPVPAENPDFHADRMMRG